MLKTFPMERSNLDNFCQKFFSCHMLLEFGGTKFFKNTATRNSSSGDQPGEKCRNERFGKPFVSIYPISFSFRNNVFIF